MPRLIILLLTLASLTTVTVQNLGEEKAVSLVVLDNPLSPIPLGLLLLGAVGAGALITLILYGLVGLHRPATSATKSKYQPMGSRVPYPETTSSTTTSSTDTSYSTTATSTAYGSGSTAFVTEPPASQSPTDKAGSTSTNPQTSEPEGANPSARSSTSSTQTGMGNPAAPSNVYSPFSRDKNADTKKKGSTVE